jgi:hypothetical protein
MKNIKVLVFFGLAFLLVSCGYKLGNKPLESSKDREYSKKTNYESVKPEK